MSLFIGRIPAETKIRDLEDIFSKFGKITRCDIKKGTSFDFGFVEFEDRACAEDAVKAHEDREFELNGSRIVVEFSKGKRERNDRDERNNDCFKCNKPGHWARDCPSLGRDRSRSRSPPRYRGRRDDYDRRDRRRSPTPPRGGYRDDRVSGRRDDYDRRDRRRSPTPPRRDDRYGGDRGRSRRSPTPPRREERARSRRSRTPPRRDDVGRRSPSPRRRASPPPRQRSPAPAKGSVSPPKPMEVDGEASSGW